MAKRPQPSLDDDKKVLLSKKIGKFVERGYIVPVEGQIGSVIKYFAVPKGVINRVIQDWRTVFHESMQGPTSSMTVCGPCLQPAYDQLSAPNHRQAHAHG
jgi:hypothetical protein